MGSYPARLQASRKKSSATFGGISAPSAVRQRLWNSTMRASSKRGNNVLLTKAARPGRASRLNTVMLGKTPAWLHQQTGRKDRRRDVERHPHRCERDKPTADHPTHLVADV